MVVDCISWNMLLEKILQGRKCWSTPSSNTNTFLWPAFHSSSDWFWPDFPPRTSLAFCILTVFGAVMLDLHHLRLKVDTWVKSRPCGSQQQSFHWLWRGLKFLPFLFKQRLSPALATPHTLGSFSTRSPVSQQFHKLK